MLIEYPTSLADALPVMLQAVTGTADRKHVERACYHVVGFCLGKFQPDELKAMMEVFEPTLACVGVDAEGNEQVRQAIAALSGDDAPGKLGVVDWKGWIAILYKFAMTLLPIFIPNFPPLPPIPPKPADDGGSGGGVVGPDR